MSGKSIGRYALIALALFLIGGLLMVDSNAQKRKRKRRSTAPKITNPEIYQPVDNTNSNNSAETSTPTENASPTPEDPEAMKKTIQTLSNQVDKLSDKLNQMEES
jgi:cytoskeletal protein RodZ